MPTVYTEVEVDVDLVDFDTDDLLEELESRGSLPVEQNGDARNIVEQIYYLRRQGQPYEHLIDSLTYAVMGRVIWLNSNGLCTVPCLDLWHRMHGPWSQSASKKHV